jgi:hypothetical protein
MIIYPSGINTFSTSESNFDILPRYSLTPIQRIKWNFCDGKGKLTAFALTKFTAGNSDFVRISISKVLSNPIFRFVDLGIKDVLLPLPHPISKTE